MAKQVNPGQLRTQIEIKAYTETKDEDGFKIRSWLNVFGEGVLVGCHWSNAHGQEVLTAASLDLREPATLTMRYSDKITPECRIYKKTDPRPYEIISLDNVNERNQWLEVRVQRTVKT
ncbi:MAG: head-tail adaptor protein [Enterococcus lemanii]|jgi:head-tail adaptor